MLKYDAEEADRDRVLQELFLERGGDEAALCALLYMSWDDARALRDAGVELGGHTVRHEILGRLEPSRQAEEIDGCRASLERELGRPGEGAVSHDVWFGRAPDRLAFQGNQLGTDFAPPDLARRSRYAWRVDEVDALGRVTPGPVWTFRTARR